MTSLTPYQSARHWLADRVPGRLRPAARYWIRRATGHLEPEMAWLLSAAGRGRVAIDAGANYGVFSYALARGGASVEAFEPHPECALQVAALSGVRVHRVALSDHSGTATLHVPIVDGHDFHSWSSIEPEARTGDTRAIMTEVRTLDSYRFTNVSALKIDVEGHELALLRGAVETIRRERPSILVEVDARRGDRSFEHAGPVIDWLAGIGYACRRMHADSPNLIAEPLPEVKTVLT